MFQCNVLNFKQTMGDDVAQLGSVVSSLLRRGKICKHTNFHERSKIGTPNTQGTLYLNLGYMGATNSRTNRMLSFMAHANLQAWQHSMMSQHKTKSAKDLVVVWLKNAQKAHVQRGFGALAC